MSPRFLELDEVLRIHQSVIERYGGSAAIRDPGLLQSAIAMPKASFGGQSAHADLFEMAAAYLFHITSNHPFVDGNKRTGAASAIVFLAINGVTLIPDEDGLAELTLAIASGDGDKAIAAEFFRRISK